MQTSVCPTEAGAQSPEHANALPYDDWLLRGYLPDKVLKSTSE